MDPNGELYEWDEEMEQMDVFCDDPECPCHESDGLLRELILEPLNEGLLTNAEALRIFWFRQV